MPKNVPPWPLFCTVAVMLTMRTAIPSSGPLTPPTANRVSNPMIMRHRVIHIETKAGLGSQSSRGVLGCSKTRYKRHQ